ncbi:hypothetical protein BH11CYA1_BH11CYA1_08820 [soil metagenome]
MVTPVGADFSPGDIVGNTYEVVGYIGRGAMGYVYHVRHVGLPKEYALKTLSTDQITDKAWLRFQIEAQSIAKMFHPNIITIHNFAVHKATGRPEQPFYVMDLLTGKSLMEELRDNDPLPLAKALLVFIQAASGIGYAHSKGIIHRDLKPGNVMLLDKPDAGGATVKIVDFGIAKLTADSELVQQHLTSAGEVFGSPYYMSPEQGLGQTVDGRSDIYSLGVTFFEALTGDVPFTARSPVEIMLLHQNAPVPQLNDVLEGGDFAPEVQIVLERMLAKEPAKRYQDMQAVVADLSAIHFGNPLPSLSAIDFKPHDDAVVEEDSQSDIAGEDSSIAGSAEEDGASASSNSHASSDRSNSKSQIVLLVISLAAIVTSVVAFVVVKNSRSETIPRAAAIAIPKVAPKSQSKVADTKPKLDPEEDKEPGSSLNETKPFSSVRTVKGCKIVTFDFPTDVLIGKIYSYNWSTGEYRTLPAKGRLVYDKGEWLCLIPSRLIGKYPQYLKRFPPGILLGIRLNENSDSDAILDSCSKIPGINYVELQSARNLTNKCIDSLSRLTKLDEFHAYHITVDGIALARAKCWDKIEKATFSDTSSLTPMLVKLKDSKNLHTLFVDESNLTYQDYKAISALTSLSELTVKNNRMTLNELKLMSNLPKLETIELRDCGLVEEAIPLLRQFKALKTLKMGTPKTLVKLRDKFKAGLPGVEVE